ncbi:EamA family transporter RarD [Leucobacter sp. cx-328]|uniref:EamA family transporter RarD n=1 Tax=unclassified Leucobacter TaxID=2621730 RepID=UPI00165E6D5F|nr:EamA family transporter RarD [Leucobacter sp. cx-328]
MNETRRGIAYGIGAYLLWGAFPLYFTLISVVSPLEIVSWRVLSTLLVCAVLVTIARKWQEFARIFKTPKLLGMYTLSALLLYANWQIFVIGVVTGHVLETSLGYFINPILTVLFGVIFWREKLTRLQWAAITIALVGVVVSAIAYGKFPWISLGLALSFGLYGVVHQRIESVDGITGLAAESVISAPIGIVQGIILAMTVGLNVFSHGAGMFALVLISGVFTAAPLILFGESTRRLPLTYVGFLQFITPIIGFLYGYLVLHESVSLGRWIGFIGVWIALVLLVTDMIRKARRTPLADAQPSTGQSRLD